jgi:Domain of unknown function (DUF4412)
MNNHVLLPMLFVLSSIVGDLRAANIAEHFKARPTQYSCDMAMTSDRGVTTMHLTQDGERKRTDVQRGKQNMVMIMRPDQQKMFMLMVERKMAMEMPYDVTKAQDDVEELSKDAAAKIEALGNETINGVVCDKFATTSGAGKKATLWIAQDQHTVQRWVNDDGKLSIEFTNYKLGAADASSFEVPADYQRMTMPTAPAPGAGPRPPMPPTPPTKPETPPAK